MGDVSSFGVHNLTRKPRTNVEAFLLLAISGAWLILLSGAQHGGLADFVIRRATRGPRPWNQYDYSLIKSAKDSNLPGKIPQLTPNYVMKTQFSLASVQV